MIPYTQTRTGKRGNCMEFAMASILHTPLDKIPDFGGNDVYLENIAKFLSQYGLYYVEVSPSSSTAKEAFKHGMNYHLINGWSYRGGPHATVGLNGNIVWDTHPQDGTRHGLKRVDCFGLLCAKADYRIPRKEDYGGI